MVLLPMLCLTLHVATQTGQPTRNLVILDMEATLGVNPQLAGVISQQLADAARKASVFSRVYTPKDMLTLLGLEEQRSLLNDCSSESCLAEIAGALGAEYVLTGNLAQVGQELLMNVRLLDARAVKVVAGYIARVPATKPESLLDEAPKAIHALVKEAGLLRAAKSVNATPAQQVPDPSGSRVSIPLVVLGGTGAGLGLPLLLVAAGMVAVSVSMVVVPALIPISTPPPLVRNVRLAVFTVAPAVPLLGAALAVLGCTGLLGAGSAVLAKGVLHGE